MRASRANNGVEGCGVGLGLMGLMSHREDAVLSAQVACPQPRAPVAMVLGLGPTTSTCSPKLPDSTNKPDPAMADAYQRTPLRPVTRERENSYTGQRFGLSRLAHGNAALHSPRPARR